MEDKKNKKKVVQLAEDGLPETDVSHYTTPEQLTSMTYDKVAMNGTLVTIAEFSP